LKGSSDGKALQKELLKIVDASGTSGISAKNLMKYFKVEDKEIDELLTHLAKRRMVKLVKVKQGNKEELFVYPYKVKTPPLPVYLNTVSEIPCFMCKYLKECEADKDPSPIKCEILKIWLEKMKGGQQAD
jgi:hypothetical protein